MLSGRTTMAELGTIPSTRHSAVKRLKETPRESPLVVFECVSPQEKVVINPKYPEQTVAIRRQLPMQFKKQLIMLQRDNVDVFAWKYSYMAGIPKVIKIGEETLVTEHKLNEGKKITPVQQKKWGMASDRSAAASKEVEELVKAGILRETRYQTLVANPVMVKKAEGAWGMCVDFTIIYKACPKDCYSLPEID
ncbi:hypothetical protein Tco_1490000 [Tanacetum coccineum]